MLSSLIFPLQCFGIYSQLKRKSLRTLFSADKERESREENKVPGKAPAPGPPHQPRQSRSRLGSFSPGTHKLCSASSLKYCLLNRAMTAGLSALP